MPIRDLRHNILLVQAGDGNEQQRVQLLRAHKRRVEQQLAITHQHLEAIDAKISLYGDSATVPGKR